ncbi:thioredoxin fold domain-containing protein [Azohydromonas aeria]|uniref:thioredoxin fold domain-containing protein n=1 Tax=Azohydromonas aeria TaxID=2590212 RepID=UPI0012F9A39A|nr:thioredoxin fold domain-containing protein [Azohydromonas aeria]
MEAADLDRGRRACLLALAAGLGGAALGGCDARVRNEKAAAGDADPVALARTATGFTAGATTARQEAFVFFDMQCPHCGRLWQASKPLQDRVRFVWIPVALLNKDSLEQGAALLGAQEPVALMDRHEAELLAGGKGLAVTDAAPAGRDQVQANTKVFQSLGAGSVPYLVARNQNSDRPVTHAGALSTGDLAALLGV